MHKNSFKFLSLFFFLFVFSASAQFYQVRNFNAENGLPSPEVYGLIQDSKGYIWFATDMGVSKYNGYEFKNYSTENGLPDNTVFGFCEDSKSRMWLRSFSGKLAYFLNDSIHILACNPVLEKEIKKRAVILMSMYVDKEGIIWIGTTDKFAIKVLPPYQSKDVAFLNIPEDGEYIIKVDSVTVVFGGSSTVKCPVTVYDKHLEKIAQAKINLNFPGKLKHRYFATILPDGTYLSSVNNVILKFNSEKVISTVQEKATVIALVEDRDKKIISAAYDSIRIHDENNLEHYETIAGFSDKIFTGVLIDNENGLWFSAEGYGVYYIPFRNGRYFTTEHGLPQSKIACFAQKNGYTFTGHLNGTVSTIKNSTISYVSFYSAKRAATFSNRISSFYTQQKDAVYVGTGFSVFKLDLNDPKKHMEYKGVVARKICKSKEDKVWVIRDRHVILCDTKGGFKEQKRIVFDQYIDEIFEDSRGILWICGLNGLWKYSNDSLSYVGEQNKVLSARIVHILEDKAGRLWMASRGQGVLVMEGDKLFTVKQENGLASNMCRNLYIDSLDVVWVGSNSGLSRIKTGNGNSFTYKVDVFTKKNGLLSNEVNYILGNENELWLAHNSGISLFNPKYFKNNTAPPPIYIINLIINNKEYKTDSLKLNFSENYFKINYVGLSYKNAGTLEYKYKMLGLDTSWVYTAYTSAQFQTLYPGDYTFIVYAKNADGYWSTKPARLYLSIRPAWWQTWLFRISAGIAFGLIAFLLIKKRLDKINKRQREKAELQNKIAVTELKALRAQMNPHFMFNALNSVQHFITSNDPDSSQRYLSKFAKLIRYVVDNSKPTAIPLEKELEAIALFLDLETLRFENRFEYHISLSPEIDSNFVHIPSMLIQPYLENAIWHGIMHKKGVGKIDVRIELLENTLKCTIEDNGIGRKRSMELKAKQGTTVHKSVGMVITKERLDIINQMNNSELSVHITDLTDDTGDGIGTRVELFIPPY